jgi:hypothetical protein
LLHGGEVNIGYNVFLPYRGLGYATCAVELLMRYLDESTTFDTATLLIHPDNAASLAVAAKSGFGANGEINGSPDRAVLRVPWSPDGTKLVFNVPPRRASFGHSDRVVECDERWRRHDPTTRRR